MITDELTTKTHNLSLNDNIFSKLDDDLSQQIYDSVTNSERQEYDKRRRNIGRYVNRLSRINDGREPWMSFEDHLDIVLDVARFNRTTLSPEEAIKQAEESYYDEHIKPIYETIVQLQKARQLQRSALSRYQYMRRIMIL